MADKTEPTRTVPRQTAAIIALIVLCSLVSAAVAYHCGSRRGPQPAAAGISRTDASAPCAEYADAAGLVGKSACISGRVLKVFTSKSGNTYLDFCEDYRSCPFSSVIFSQDRSKFGDLATLQGQVVEIRGLVSYYKERPQIVIRAPEQLKLRE